MIMGGLGRDDLCSGGSVPLKQNKRAAFTKGSIDVCVDIDKIY